MATDRDKLKMKQIIKARLTTKIRIIDAAMVDDLDPYFLLLFHLYWMVTQPLKKKNGREFAIDLIKAGLRAKFNKEASQTKEKISTFCDLHSITGEELIEMIQEEFKLEMSIEDLLPHPEDTTALDRVMPEE